MSDVTNVMVSHSVLEEPATHEALATPISGGYGQSLRNIADGAAGDAWGGHKAPEVEVWAAAFNHVGVSEILAHVEGVPWEEPHAVQVFINVQDDVKFTVYEFRNGRLQRIDRAGNPNDD